ncbi:hypothetical protein QYM36_002096 [Artemia franciscana]|uniref:Uncharacterized protein n=1 Tax=Artemia franciscana TaxID=6661 RepID=A0AA88IBR5_ARTSF|nr:hypothetical protein QYM36_002096 [Artemia franciscana]
MNQISKTEQVLKEMRQYLIDILVLSEIRWTGNGLEKFGDGYVMAFSGHPSVHRAGVGLLMVRAAKTELDNLHPADLVYQNTLSKYKKFPLDIYSTFLHGV